mmetsp:Transcript_12751/g.23019  ORF Transcript_12751/g.23019 Transcript_12751/m.23019 type:complete len:209 (-) Transcript_12751:299-925(-)
MGGAQQLGPCIVSQHRLPVNPYPVALQAWAEGMCSSFVCPVIANEAEEHRLTERGGHSAEVATAAVPVTIAQPTLARTVSILTLCKSLSPLARGSPSDIHDASRVSRLKHGPEERSRSVVVSSNSKCNRTNRCIVNYTAGTDQHFFGLKLILIPCLAIGVLMTTLRWSHLAFLPLGYQIIGQRFEIVCRLHSICKREARRKVVMKQEL